MARYEFDIERLNLVNSLRRKGIDDEAVLQAINSVPRELFISADMSDRAYDDNALPIDCRQTISQPYTVAYMTQCISIERGDKVLEIGTGSGYQSCILWAMGADVFTIERIPELLEQARYMFDKLEMDINSKLGDGTIGWPEYAPFDSIIVTAAAPSSPEELKKQIKIGGKIVIPIGGRDYQTMHIIEKLDSESFNTRKTDNFKFVPLIGEEGWKRE